MKDNISKTVLVVMVPRGVFPHTAKELEAMRDYVYESIMKGVLVLGVGTEFELEKFPELDDVQVRTADGAHCTAEMVVSESDTAAPPEDEQKQEQEQKQKQEQDQEQEQPPVLREHNLKQPTKQPPKKKGRELLMTPGEIVTSYRQAANPVAQLRVLADLNVCSKDDIIEVLAAQGVEVKKKAGRPRKKAPDET